MGYRTLKYRNLLISFFVLLAFFGAISFISAIGTGRVEIGLALFFWIMIIRIVAVIVGAIILMLRGLSFLKSTNFVYILAGELNLVLGGFFAMLFFLGKGSPYFNNDPWNKLLLLLNLIIGIVILGSLFLGRDD